MEQTISTVKNTNNEFTLNGKNENIATKVKKI